MDTKSFDQQGGTVCLLPEEVLEIDKEAVVAAVLCRPAPEQEDK